MGAACSKRRPRSKKDASIRLSASSLEEDLRPADPKRELDFHQSLLSKLKPESPLATAELRQIVDKEYSRLLRTGNSPGFIVKLQAKEVYYNYINDKHSYDYYVKLKRRLVEQMTQELLTPEATLVEYKRLAKGTFAIHGLEEMHQLVHLYKQTPDTIEEALKTQRARNLGILQDQLDQLRDMFVLEDSDVLSLLALSPTTGAPSKPTQEPASPQLKRQLSTLQRLKHSRTCKELSNQD